MRIVIDLQGAQGTSRYRGIGRYSLTLAQAMARNRGEHEIIIALNGMFPDSIEPIRAAFDGLIPQENIRVWSAVGPVNSLDPANTWRRHVAQLLRESFLASLRADFIHVTSPFEGLGDDAVFSLGLIPDPTSVAVTLYDLIPLIQSDKFFKSNSAYEAFYKERLFYLKRTSLYLAISESARSEVINHLDATDNQAVNIGAAADDSFEPIYVSEFEKAAIRKRLGIHKSFVMYSSATDGHKNHLRLIKAFSVLPLGLRKFYQLVLVGKLPSEHRKKFEYYARICGLTETDVIITGWVSDKELVQLYNMCELFVFPSWHEGFGLPLLEAMSCGAPVIAASTTSLPEVVGREDALFNPFDVMSISNKMGKILTNDLVREDLSKHSLERAKKFSWEKCAKKAFDAMESDFANPEGEINICQNDKFSTDPSSWLIETILKITDMPVENDDWMKLAQCIVQNHPVVTGRQLLVDISELVARDSKVGVQRVTRGVIWELLNDPPEEFRVKLVYGKLDGTGYVYAERFTAHFLGDESRHLEDTPIETLIGDIFLGLDLQHHVVITHANYFRHIRNLGVKVYFMVHDILPLLMPTAFPDGMADLHERWLSEVAKADGIVCVSRTVADEVMDWLDVFGPRRLRPLQIGWSHNAANLEGSVPSKGLPTDAAQVLGDLNTRPTFLIVSTLEPRKGQMQTLLAFDQLWEGGLDVNLVLVGKHGWNVDLLVDLLSIHPERGRRLFWLEGISDEYLEKVYAASTCLIAASEGEGFGLPLIEAAQYGLPIIARDIPVFREVAGENAVYFSGLAPDLLASAVRDWLILENQGLAPQSEKMQFLTWRQSTKSLLDVVVGGDWYRQWMPDGVLRYWGSDRRLDSVVGQRMGRYITSDGQAGCLLHGPYISLPAGEYQVVVRADSWGAGAAGARADVVVEKTSKILAEHIISEHDLEHGLITLQISLETPCTDLEVRVWINDATCLRVSAVELTPKIEVPLLV